MSLLIDLSLERQQDIIPLYAITKSPVTSSSDGRKLTQLWEQVNRQWCDRESLENMNRDNDRDLKHVPFRTAGKIKVRFQKATPMEPRRLEQE